MVPFLYINAVAFKDKHICAYIFPEQLLIHVCFSCTYMYMYFCC